MEKSTMRRASSRSLTSRSISNNKTKLRFTDYESIKDEVSVQQVLDAVQPMEAAGYPLDEAASLQALEFRLRNAPRFFFLVMEEDLITEKPTTKTKPKPRAKTNNNNNNDDESAPESDTNDDDSDEREGDEADGDAVAVAVAAAATQPLSRRRERFSELNIVAFMCGTVTDSSTLKPESMSTHVPDGRMLCIHSVVSRVNRQGRGLARRMLAQAVEQVRKRYTDIDVMMLISRRHLVPFYKGCGFSFAGKSAIVHGKQPWYEMKLRVRSSPLVCVDAFVLPDAPSFTGNPAAVAWLPPVQRLECTSDGIRREECAAIETAWMQQVAAQMNLSDTAFVRPLDDVPKHLEASKSTSRSRAQISKVATLVRSPPRAFHQIIAAIDELFVFHPTGFIVGTARSSEYENQTTCKILALAMCANLTRNQTLLLWGEHAKTVMKDPTGTSHSLLRAFLKVGPSGVKFESFPLEARLKVVPKADQPDLRAAKRFELRWFTPTKEVEVCGHATMGAAFALWTCSGLANFNVDPKRLVFETKGGELVATRDEDFVTLDFPQEAPEELELSSLPCAILKGLGLSSSPESVLYYGKNRMDVLVEVTPEAFASMVKVDMDALSEIVARGVLVTTRVHATTSDEDLTASTPATTPATATPLYERYQCDFRSRGFFPRFGIPEDPVTGSAHCCLGPYWANKLDKSKLVAFQDSPRGGLLKLEMVGDSRIRMSGSASLSLDGTLHSKNYVQIVKYAKA